MPALEIRITDEDRDPDRDDDNSRPAQTGKAAREGRDGDASAADHAAVHATVKRCPGRNPVRDCRIQPPEWNAWRIRRPRRRRAGRRRNRLTLALQPLVGLRHHGVQVGLVAQAQDHRIARLDVGAVPVRAVAHLLDGVLGGAHQLADLRLGQLRVVAQQEGDGVRAVVALGDGGVARALAALGRPARPEAAASAGRPDPPRSARSRLR